MITQKRFEEIQRIAFSHVHSFVEKRAIQPGKLIRLGQPGLATKSGLLSPESRDFAAYVVLKEFKDKWGTDGLPSAREAELNPLFVGMFANRMGDLEGFPSWLYLIRRVSVDSKPIGCPLYAAVFDDEYITNFRHKQPPEIVLIRLFYHELGHFVLHRTELFGDLTNPIIVRPAAPGGGEQELYFRSRAQPHHEEEAWVYATAVIGLGLGDHAHSRRRSNLPDDTWLYT